MTAVSRPLGKLQYPYSYRLNLSIHFRARLRRFSCVKIFFKTTKKERAIVALFHILSFFADPPPFPDPFRSLFALPPDPPRLFG